MTTENERAEFEAATGHPQQLWDALKAKVQDQDIEQFRDVQSDFIGLVWCLDQYRISQIAPSGMGNLRLAPDKRLPGIYRGKGYWFSELLALLLENRTASRLAPKGNVQGFSQLHQIDIAWPVRGRPLRDPLVCAETKMTGAPGYGSTPARTGTADWSNRRKELKFAATDLKLYRRQDQTKIDHWDHWRKAQPPKTYFLWGARMHSRDRLHKMLEEVRALTDTYLDGAGLLPYQANRDNSAYEVVEIPQRSRISKLDDVLHAMANEIRDRENDPDVVEPVIPVEVVDVHKLAADQKAD